MFIKKAISLVLLCFLLGTSLVGCEFYEVRDKTTSSNDCSDSVTFCDTLGNQVTVSNPARVGVASGSLAECWMLAGATPVAVTEDALEEWSLDLPKDTFVLGSTMRPSAEAILEADLDFMILSANMKHHIALGEILNEAGIPHGYFEVETFEDYLNLLEIFTTITGRKDLYEKNGTAVAQEIESLLLSYQNQNPSTDDCTSVLILRTSSSKVTARNSHTMVGQMLKNLGCSNIADTNQTLLEELSTEVIVKEDPDYIFVICHGDLQEAKANLETLMASNPIWESLSAVKNQNLHYLEKELFHYKPNARWAESYQKLIELLGDASTDM